MVEEGFEVHALHIYTGFSGPVRRDIQRGRIGGWTPPQAIVDGIAAIGARLVGLDRSDEFLDTLLNPRYGYGSAANPCIDCHRFMLEQARDYCREVGGGFVFTGEVLGQRPMSQNRNSLDAVAKRSGLTGHLVRPLSAKLMPPSIPEQEGILIRDHLYDIEGRSRQRQIALAEHYGIDWYPNSGPGCVLTEKGFGRKFFDLLEHTEKGRTTKRELMSLKSGRHFRLPTGLKVLCGRTEEENIYLENVLGGTCWQFDTVDVPGTTAFACGEPDNSDFAFVASLCARYSKGRDKETVRIVATRKGERREIDIAPAPHSMIEPFLI